MKFTGIAKDLAEALSPVINVAYKSSTFPASTQVKITAGDKFIGLAVTNLDVSMRLALKDTATVVEKGPDVCVQAHDLVAVLRRLPPTAQVTCSVDDKFQLTVKSGKSKYVLKGIGQKDYPKLPVLSDEVNRVVMATPVLRTALEAASSCMPDNDVRMHLYGIRLERGDTDNAAFISCNGATLSVCNVNSKSNIETPVTLPKGLVDAALKMVGKVTSDCTLVYDADRVGMQFETATARVQMLCKRYNDKFVDWRAYIPAAPQDRLYRIEMNTADLRDALKRIEVAAVENRVLHTLVTSDFVRFQARTLEGCEAEEEVGVRTSRISNLVEDLHLGLSLDYLNAALAAVASEMVVLSFDAATEPVTVSQAGPVDEQLSYQAVVMPSTL